MRVVRWNSPCHALSAVCLCNSCASDLLPRATGDWIKTVQVKVHKVLCCAQRLFSKLYQLHLQPEEQQQQLPSVPKALAIGVTREEFLNDDQRQDMRLSGNIVMFSQEPPHCIYSGYRVAPGSVNRHFCAPVSVRRKSSRLRLNPRFALSGWWCWCMVDCERLMRQRKSGNAIGCGSTASVW